MRRSKEERKAEEDARMMRQLRRMYPGAAQHLEEGRQEREKAEMSGAEYIPLYVVTPSYREWERTTDLQQYFRQFRFAGHETFDTRRFGRIKVFGSRFGESGNVRRAAMELEAQTTIRLRWSNDAFDQLRAVVFGPGDWSDALRQAPKAYQSSYTTYYEQEVVNELVARFAVHCAYCKAIPDRNEERQNWDFTTSPEGHWAFGKYCSKLCKRQSESCGPPECVAHALAREEAMDAGTAPKPPVIKPRTFGPVSRIECKDKAHANIYAGISRRLKRGITQAVSHTQLQALFSPIVYVALKAGRVHYIGMSEVGLSRLNVWQHHQLSRIEGDWDIAWWHFGSKFAAQQAEQSLIWALKPSANRNGREQRPDNTHKKPASFDVVAWSELEETGEVNLCP